MGGYDEKLEVPYLCYIDYLAAQFETPFVMHGHGGRFCYSIMDRFYKPDMTNEEVVGLVKKCISELKTRFILNYEEFMVIQIDKDGVKELDPLKAQIQ